MSDPKSHQQAALPVETEGNNYQNNASRVERHSSPPAHFTIPPDPRVPLESMLVGRDTRPKHTEAEQIALMHEDRQDRRVAFETARQEILLRINLRDRWLWTFTAAIGGIVAFVTTRHWLALLIPFLAMTCSAMVAMHTAVVHSKCAWTRSSTDFDHWAKSKHMRKLHHAGLPGRAIVQTCVFVGPSVVALYYAAEASQAAPILLSAGTWWFAGVCTLAAGVFQWCAVRHARACSRQAGYDLGPPS